MARRRGDGPPGLIDRVRWGNVGRLAAVLAAVLLVAVEQGACGKDQQAPLARQRGLLPDQGAAAAEYGGGSADPQPSAPVPDSPLLIPPDHKKGHRRANRRKPAKAAAATGPEPAAHRAPRGYLQAPATRPARPHHLAAPRRRYSPPPAARYRPPPEPPRGAPEFL